MPTPKPVEVRHKAILITINRSYRDNMTPEELYEATRGIWVIGTRRDEAEYAIAVYKGIVREVYSIDKWYPSGTLKYQTRGDVGPTISPRWEFSGEVAHKIRDEYVNFYIGKGNQNPIHYVNV